MKPSITKLPPLLRLLRTLLLSASGIAVAAADPPVTSPLKGFNAEIQARVRSGRDTRVDDTVALYNRWFPAESDIASSSTADLKEQLKALTTVSHLVPDARVGTAAERLLKIIQLRDALTPEDISLLHRIFLSERRFSAAMDLQHRFPTAGLPATPTVQRLAGSGAANAYAVSADGTSLLEREMKMQEFSGIVAIGHPACGFSRDAAGWMEETLDPATSRTIRWLAPVDGNLMLRTFASWNAQHPQHTLSIARHELDWPFVSRWDTPQFYRFVDGQLKGHISGWTSEQQITLAGWLTLSSEQIKTPRLRNRGSTREDN